jgi:hypothetical protein
MRGDGIKPHGSGPGICSLPAWQHGGLKDACYRENLFEALSDAADVHLVEDVSAYSFSRDDVRRGQLLQVACNYRAVLRQAIGARGDVRAS